MIKEKLDELISAVKELTLQNEEKEKRAAELVIANEELAFQNEEKGKRAAELIIANEELAFQSQEKEKRAAELIVANEELAFQNKEKEKRAEELSIANEKLKQLLQLNSDKDLFISILAHDLRSPFTALLGLSDLLLENIRDYNIDEIENLVILINKSAQNTFALLEDLLKWARMQSGIIPFNPQKLNFTDICRDFLEILRSTASIKNIIINCFVIQEISIFADIEMFKAIFRNLVSNAIKFTNSGGQIDISAETNNTEVTITISDNGIGIDPETLTKLFDISQRNTTTGTAEETGSGFGLLLCKEFVVRHHGIIWAESEPGKGTKFKFTLPLFRNQENTVAN